jgi:rubrerythrin
MARRPKANTGDIANPDPQERIRRRAYELWEQEGRQEGRAEHYWHRAEAEVASVNLGDEAPPGTPGAHEHVCPACEGKGRIGRKRCPVCGGTGRVVEVPEP